MSHTPLPGGILIWRWKLLQVEMKETLRRRPIHSAELQKFNTKLIFFKKKRSCLETLVDENISHGLSIYYKWLKHRKFLLGVRNTQR
jgi:hypothetical protein